MCVRLIVGWRISRGLSCARLAVEILMVEAMSSRERIKTVFFMAMLHFIFYTLFSRDVVCSVMLDSCAIFAVSTNCWPESATGALLAAGKTAPRGDAIFFDCDGSSSEKILVIRRFIFISPCFNC